MVGAPLGWGYPVPLIIKLTQNHLKNKLGIYWVYHPLLKGSNGGGVQQLGAPPPSWDIFGVFTASHSPQFFVRLIPFQQLKR